MMQCICYTTSFTCPDRSAARQYKQYCCNWSSTLNWQNTIMNMSCWHHTATVLSVMLKYNGGIICQAVKTLYPNMPGLPTVCRHNATAQWHMLQVIAKRSAHTMACLLMHICATAQRGHGQPWSVLSDDAAHQIVTETVINTIVR